MGEQVNEREDKDNFVIGDEKSVQLPSAPWGVLILVGAGANAMFSTCKYPGGPKSDSERDIGIWIV